MSITRVHYRERQRLTAADLQAEQDYRLGLAGRHHLGPHDWGVVRGLRLIPNDQGGYTLTRGVAIDGHGREILVPEPIELEFKELNTCWWVLIYYCEYPEQVPPGRRCEDDPAPRIAHRAVWVVTDRFTPPTHVSDDLLAARAAGRPSSLRPWPVVVARVGLACQAEDVPDAVDYSKTRYVRHRASVVRSPHERAVMQLGLASRTDIYHFLLSTRDNGSALARRIGIDRDGVTHVWRPLIVFGAQAVGQVALSQSRLLKITSPTPGLGRRIRITGEFDPVKRILAATFVDLSDAGARLRPALHGVVDFKDVYRAQVVPVRFGDTRTATFGIVDSIRDEPIAWVETKRRGKKVQPVSAEERQSGPISFSVELEPSGGQIQLRRLQQSSETAPPDACGDIERHRADAGEPGTPVVQFRPANEIAGDPLAREIHAVTTSKPTDPVPKTELRISGGAEDESDAATRVSVGAWMDNQGMAEWMPSLQMDGGRRLEILARAGTVPTHPLLEVDDTVYLPPIGNKDPLLPDMMAMAFMAGLRQIGRVVPATSLKVTLTEPPPPTPIVRGQTLEYTLEVTWTGQVQVKRCVETITGISGTGDMAFRSLTGVDLTGAASPKAFTITTEKFMHPASKVRIEVQILAKRGAVTGVAVSPPVELDVVDQ